MNTETIEYVGNLHFDPADFDLTSIPDNDEAAAQAVEMIPYIRMAALLLQGGDKELEAQFAGTEGLEAALELLEEIVKALDVKRSEVEILTAGYARLQVICERAVGEAVFAEAEGGAS